MKRLTDNQERFVQELIKGKSQREAYRIAYPKSKNWKDSAVDETASKLLKSPKVFPRYNELRDRLIKEAEDECMVTAKEVLRELSYIAFSKATDYARIVEKGATTEVDGMLIPILDENGNQLTYRTVEPVLTVELTEEQMRALGTIKRGRDGFEIKPYDKVRALELLGKHLGMFKDKLEIDAPDMELNIVIDYGDNASDDE